MVNKLTVLKTSNPVKIPPNTSADLSGSFHVKRSDLRMGVDATGLSLDIFTTIILNLFQL